MVTRVSEIDSRIAALEHDLGAIHREKKEIKETGLQTNRSIEVLEGSLKTMRDQLLLAMQQMQDKLVLQIEAKFAQDRLPSPVIEVSSNSKDSATDRELEEPSECPEELEFVSSGTDPEVEAVFQIVEKAGMKDIGSVKKAPAGDEPSGKNQKASIQRLEIEGNSTIGIESETPEEAVWVGDDGSVKMENHQKELKEELARNLEKLMVAAREVQMGEALWVLGLTLQQKFKPIFLLQVSEDESGFHSGPDPELLGPPPWCGCPYTEIRPTLGQFLVDCTSRKRELGFMGPYFRPNSSDCKIGELGEKRHGLFAGRSSCSLLQPRVRLTERSHERIFMPPIPPPEEPILLAKPPPQPPDHLLKFVRLEVKAVFVGSISARTLTREGKHVDGFGCVLQPPPEPPPYYTIALGYTFVTKVVEDTRENQCGNDNRFGAYDTRDGSERDLRMPKSMVLIYHSPRPPELAIREDGVKPREFSWLMGTRLR